MNGTGLNELLDKTTEASMPQETLSVFANVVLVLNIALTAVLNPLCILALRRTSNLQETTKMFMASLTASDLCIGLFCGIPLWTTNVSGKWILGDFLCTLLGILYPTFNTLNVLSLLFLTIDRFIAIVRPLRYPTLVTPRTSRLTIAFTTASTVIIYVIILGIFRRASLQESQCVPSCDFCLYIYIGLLVIPLTVILMLYASILKNARRQARRIAAQITIGDTHLVPNAQRRISTKSATTVFIIAGALCICWTPHVMLLLLLSQGVVQPHSGVYNVTQCIVYANNWLNVVIYYWRNRELRQALHALFSCC